MLCCAVLCCAVLCCAVLCCAVLCCAVLCCAVPCRAVLCCEFASNIAYISIKSCHASQTVIHFQHECGRACSTGITARRHDSTGSGIFPSQAADSVLDGTGMRAWSGSVSPPSAPGSSGQGGFNGEGSQKGTSPEPASHSAEVSPAKELQYGAPPRDTRLDGDGRAPGHAPGSARTAQDPTFDAIFDDILAS